MSVKSTGTGKVTIINGFFSLSSSKEDVETNTWVQVVCLESDSQNRK